MQKTELKFSQEARQKIQQGVDKLSKAVVATLGPSGRNVILTHSIGNPTSTKDGVSVARAINLEDPYENVGAQIIKQASIKTGEQAGDGTTTSTLIAANLYFKSLDTEQSTHNTGLVDVRKGIEIACKEGIECLKGISKDITEDVELKQVATISGNNDESVGEIVSSALVKTGTEGVVTVEESQTGETYLDIVEGMELKRGYLSPYFVTDNKAMSATLTDPYILIVNEKISQVKNLLPILEMISSQDKSLLIIAEDIMTEALSTLILNKVKGTLKVAAIKAPDFGDRRTHILEDIATITGGEVVSKEKGRPLHNFNPSMFGKAKKVNIFRDSTVIVDGAGTEDKIIERVEEIKAQIEKSTSIFETENLQKRLASLAGGVAVVYVGGMTDVEMKERKDRVEDALHATRAALEEGIVPGGGKALLTVHRKLSKLIENVNYIKNLNPDQLTGFKIFIEVLKLPAEYILANRFKTGNSIIEDICNELVESENLWAIYDPRTEDYVDAQEKGIIDPTKVVRLSLENAVSAAGTLLTTEAIVAIKEEKQDTQQQLANMMGM